MPQVTTHSAKTEVQVELLEAAGCLQSRLLVCLIDLPRLTAGSKAGVWSKVAEIDKLVAGLGNKPGKLFSPCF